MQELADRDNKQKLRWRNFPMFMLRPLAKVAQFGEGRYSTYNYLKGGSQNQYLDCIKRHLDKYEDPTQSDLDLEDEFGQPGSQESHLAHIAWNALVALYMLDNFPELDDRFKIERND